MKKMRLNKILAALAVTTAIAFFALIAASTLDNYLKAVFLLADLMACGALLKRLTEFEGYYGLLLLRSEKGFNTMSVVAKLFANQSRFIAEWGFTVGFGLPYSFHVFRKQKQLKRFAALALAAIFFEFFFFLFQPAGSLDSLLFITFAVTALAGLFGMGLLLLAQHAFSVLTVSGTAPGVTLLIPFVTVPWEAAFAIVIIIIVHELAHGVLCRIEKIRLRSSGLLLLGFIPIGAFVEPDEKQLAKAVLPKKRRILAAGSASNLLFFTAFLCLTAATTIALQQTIAGIAVEKTLVPQFTAGEQIFAVDGIQVKSAEALKTALIAKSTAGKGTALFETSSGEKNATFVRLLVQKVNSGSPSEGVLHAGEEIMRVNGVNASDVASLRAALAKAGNVAVLETSEGVKRVSLGPGGKLGVELAQKLVFQARDVPRAGFEWIYALLSFLAVVFFWTYSLNFILALVNLLPIVITDGQRIVFEEASAKFGKKNGLKISLAFSAIALALLALNALPWFLQ